MKLYGYWRSSCSYRVRIALNLKGLAYEQEAVHLVQGDQHAGAHLARNAKAEVPVLELDGGELLTQSVAICEYLDEIHPSPSLLPRDAMAKARVREMVEVVNAGIQPLQNFAVLKAVGELGADKKAWIQGVIERGFVALEKLAAKSAGRYLHGDSVSLADVVLVPQVYNALRFEVDMAQFPTLKRVHEACEELDAFKRAHPSAQPDAA